MGTRLGALRERTRGRKPFRPEESLDAVWRHLGEALLELAEKVRERGERLPERGLTQELVTVLEVHGNRPYFFQKEFLEEETSGSSPAVDIAVQAREDGGMVVEGISVASGARFLALEAKRLPTPGAGREREYLEGRMGGVERFKRGIHARDLRTVGMIGYLQRGSFSYWQETLNDWVADLMTRSPVDLVWDENDKLSMEDSSDRIAWLRSRNSRIADQQPLTIRHAWLRF